MEQAELITLVTEEVKGLSTSLVSDDYENAVDDAERETGWTLPQTSSFRILWLKQRAKRHLFFYLLSEAAHKFKYKQINLQHRFEHYRSLIADMDKDFAEIQLSEIAEFANVSEVNLFGTKVDAGFAYEDQTGRDMTHDDENVVLFTPTESD